MHRTWLKLIKIQISSFKSTKVSKLAYVTVVTDVDDEDNHEVLKKTYNLKTLPNLFDKVNLRGYKVTKAPITVWDVPVYAQVSVKSNLH